MHKFPKDCWVIKCPHVHSWDLSIDDWVSSCDLLKKQIDDCDSDYCFLNCPLSDEERKEICK